MAAQKIRELSPGYRAEIDTVTEHEWVEILHGFDDANIYQTWSYAEVDHGRGNTSRLVLRRDGAIVAVAQVRIAKLPFIKAGIAYIRWGPVWRRSETEAPAETFRQAIRALRNEFVCRRNLVLRVFPVVFNDEGPIFPEILADEAFSSLGNEQPGRTLLIDLTHSLKDLRGGMARNWRRNLKTAEESGLEVLEGSGDELFESFIGIYEEMVSRKKFAKPNDIHQYRLIQRLLPERLKMKIMLCKSEGRISAGLIWSEIGKMGIELFAATSNTGVDTKGSFLLRWKLAEKLKANGNVLYNLNGINPIKNPGSYKFKSELAGKNGKDVYYLGRFDSHAGVLSRSCVEYGEALIPVYRTIRALPIAGRGKKSSSAQ